MFSKLLGLALGVFLSLLLVGVVRAQEVEESSPSPLVVVEEGGIGFVPDPESRFFGLQVAFMNVSESIEKLVAFTEVRIAAVEDKYAARNERLTTRMEALIVDRPEMAERLGERLVKLRERQDKRLERLGERLLKLQERGEKFEERKGEWVLRMQERRENMEIRREEARDRLEIRRNGEMEGSGLRIRDARVRVGDDSGAFDEIGDDEVEELD